VNEHAAGKQEQEPEVATAGSEPAAQSELGGLMASGDLDTAARIRRMEEEAMVAAERVFAEAESALAEAETVVAEERATAHASEGARDGRAPRQQVVVDGVRFDLQKLWILRCLLVLNLVLVVVMFTLPGRGPAPAHDPQPREAPPVPEGFDAKPREGLPALPTDKLYDEALIAGRDGEYPRAAELMKRYVEAHPDLHPALLQGSYTMLGRYLRLAGRTDEAIRYEVEAQRLIGVSQLPSDLWQAAREAESRGDAQSMRQAYARIILQRDMLTPSQLAVVTEAYLKLGDSYRMAAQEGQAAAEAEELERERRLREQGAEGRR
jgi:hypothetical protein